MHSNEMHFNGRLKSVFFFLLEMFLAVEFILIGHDL